MNTVNYLEVNDPITQTTTTFAIIDKGNEEYVSMPKSVYDAQQAASTLPSELSTPTTPQAGA